MSTKKKPVKSAVKTKAKAKTTAKTKTVGKTKVKAASKPPVGKTKASTKPAKKLTSSKKGRPSKTVKPPLKAAKPTARQAAKQTAKKSGVTPKKTGIISKTPPVKKQTVSTKTETTSASSKKSPAKPASAPADSKTKALKVTKAAKAEKPAEAAAKPAGDPKPAPAKSQAPKTTLDDLALDVEEKDRLLEEEKRDLIKALREDEDEPLETAFVPTDTSERIILVVDEEGQRRVETVTIVSQILPNAVVEVADDPDEALEIMQDCDFDTYVVNFLMPGFSASPFVKAVANHQDHPLLIGFAADKISDALDQRKGLKIIPLKRLFDLDVATDAAKDKSGGAED